MDSPEFDAFSQAIQQKEFSQKMSGLANKRSEQVAWAIEDGLKKGIAADEVSVISSPYYATPNSSQLREAETRQVEPGTGNIVPHPSGTRLTYSAEIAEQFRDELIPAARPAVGGLRRFLRELRLDRAERRVRESERHQAAAGYAGTIILRNKFGDSLVTHADKQALQLPRTRRDRKTIRVMDKMQVKKQQINSRISQLELLQDGGNGLITVRRERKIRKLEQKRDRFDRDIHHLAYEAPKRIKVVQSSLYKKL